MAFSEFTGKHAFWAMHLNSDQDRPTVRRPVPVICAWMLGTAPSLLYPVPVCGPCTSVLDPVPACGPCTSVVDPAPHSMDTVPVTCGSPGCWVQPTVPAGLRLPPQIPPALAAVSSEPDSSRPENNKGAYQRRGHHLMRDISLTCQGGDFFIGVAV